MFYRTHQVEGEKQRYIVGVVLSEGEKEADKELEEKLVKEEGFKTTTFPEVTHMVMTSFPEVNSLSILIAVQRVYPVFGDYIVVSCSGCFNSKIYEISRCPSSMWESIY